MAVFSYREKGGKIKQKAHYHAVKLYGEWDMRLKSTWRASVL